ncbi:MAG: flagellar hook-length control protein FliK [Cellulosilyticum sp.]|nr:flagellar hook-length control protein FliK [Cellulosilyticum sp.]
MSQVNLASIFLGATHNNTSTNLSATNNNQKQSFSQNLSKAKETVSQTETYSTQKNKDKVEQSKQNKEPVTKDIKNSQNNKNVQDNKEVQDKSTKELDETLDIQDHEELDTEKVLEDQILAMISQALQIPIEEIQMQLEGLGLEVQDLLTEEGFGQFVNQLFARGDINALLAGDIDIKQISTLFDRLTTFAEEMKGLSQEEQVFSEMPIESHIETNDLTNGQDLMQTNPVMSEVIVEETVGIEEIGGNVKQPSEASDEPVLTFTNEQAQGDSDLGITVPIHNFTTTSFTQTFETETGVVAQTTTKQMVNGKAFIEQVDFKVLSQTKELNISLSPKELGQMNIKIVEQNGAMVAEIKVENEKAKEFILNEISNLKDSLEEQGLNVTDVKVDIRQDNHQTQMEQEKQKSSKRIQDILAKHLNEEESEEEIVDEPIMTDSEIDYMV